MKQYFHKSDDFYLFQDDGNTLLMTYGKLQGIAIELEYPLKDPGRNEKIKKMLKYYKDQGFVQMEVNTDFQPDAVKIIKLKDYTLKNAMAYYENPRTGQFFEAGIYDQNVHWRTGPIDGVGILSRLGVSSSDKKYLKSKFIQMIQKKEKEGFKPIKNKRPTFSLSVIIKEFEEKEIAQKKRKADIESAVTSRELKIEILLEEYRFWEEKGLRTSPLKTWPRCLEILGSREKSPKEGIPRFLSEAPNLSGVTDWDNPINSLKVLGECQQMFFRTCPHTPEWHQPEKGKGAELKNQAIQLINSRQPGIYIWSDFDLKQKERNLPVRMVFNTGDADSNDGIWGCLWHRESREELISIESTGDGETTISITEKGNELYKNQGIDLPEKYDEDKYNYALFQSVRLAKGTELERLVHLVVLCILFPDLS